MSGQNKNDIVDRMARAEYNRKSTAAINELDRCIRIAKAAGLTYGQAAQRGLFTRENVG